MATDERDTQREVICQEDMVKHRIDKLCREIAERHGFYDIITEEITDPDVLKALREAYDKGHDAGARAQRLKDAQEELAMLPPRDVSRIERLAREFYDADLYKRAFEDHLKCCPGVSVIMPVAAIRAGKE